MEHYYNNYRKQQKERERIMQSGCLIFAVLMAMMLTAWLVWQRGMLVEARTEAATESLAGQVLRLHVLADSDSLRDQQIKMQVKEEIITLTTSRQFEQKIMNMIPFFIIVYVEGSSPGFFDQMYCPGMGRVLMTMCLILYLTAFWLSERILDIEV